MNLKTLSILLLAVLIAPTMAFGMASFDFPVVAPVVTVALGDVTIKGAGATGWDPAEVGRLLASGDTIRTGVASKAEITCATGKMRLYENTVIIVPEVVDEGDKQDIRAVTLDDGTGLFRIKKRGVKKGFEVKTSNIIAGVKGTLFAVLHKKTQSISRVAVYSGVVEVTDSDRTPSTSTSLSKGEFIDILEDLGFGETEDFDPEDVWNEWEKLSNPSVDFTGIVKAISEIAPAVYSGIVDQRDEGDEYDCPPVVDNDGNVIIQ